MDNVTIHGSVSSESVPVREGHGQNKKARLTPYGELVVTHHGKGAYAMAGEGSYYTATNPTPGTAILGIAAANGLDDEEALLYLRNTATAGEGKRIYLDYLRLTTVAVGTNGTTFGTAMVIDSGNDRYASGGSAITPKNVNMDSSETAPVSLYFGAVVPTAETSAKRIVSHDAHRTTIKVAGDKYLFDFGADRKSLGTVSSDGTGRLHMIVPCPPVVIGPQQMFLLHEFAASQSVAASYEFELGFWVR